MCRVCFAGTAPIPSSQAHPLRPNAREVLLDGYSCRKGWMAAIADELDGEETVGEGFGGLDWKGGECPLLLGL